MKKILLSSIIMLGVCGIASAQTGSAPQGGVLVGDKAGKLKNQTSTTTSAAAPTPQKAAIMPSSDAAVAAPVTTSDDKAATSAIAPVKATDAVSSTTVNAAGEVVPATDAARREAKMAAVKAANEQKPGKQQ
jgi:hypothetical protein